MWLPRKTLFSKQVGLGEEQPSDTVDILGLSQCRTGIIDANLPEETHVASFSA